MKIALITITFNDAYKLEEWRSHYEGYKDQVFLHIIVDNGSSLEYKKSVRDKFPNSQIIERLTNGGCTGAYNDGINFALKHSEIDAVMLLGNDIKLDRNAIPELAKSLEDSEKLGMVAPVLLKKDCEVIEDYGCSISRMLLMKPAHLGESYNKIVPYTNYCQALTGGANLARKEFYIKVGLQDKNLFMYSDEVDMGIRAQKNGFHLAAVGSAIAWHQHINKDVYLDRREPYTKYLVGRNKIYLLRRHFGAPRAIEGFIFYCLASLYKIGIHLFTGNFSNIKEYVWLMMGAMYGLLGDMRENKYSKPRAGDLN